MNPPSFDIAQMLIGDSIVSQDKVFVGSDPISLNATYAVVTDFGGRPNPKWLRDTYRVQVRVRGRPNNYPEAYEMVRNIRDYLLGKSPTEVGIAIYKRFIITSDIAFLGFDDNNKPVFSINFEIGVDYTDSTGTNRYVIN